jgi:hypothetical protein
LAGSPVRQHFEREIGGCTHKKKQDTSTYLKFSYREKTFIKKNPEANKIRKDVYEAYMIYNFTFYFTTKQKNLRRKNWPLYPNATRIRVKYEYLIKNDK